MMRWNLNTALAGLAALILVALWVVPQTRPHAESRRLIVLDGNPHAVETWDQTFPQGITRETSAQIVAGFSRREGFSAARSVLSGGGKSPATFAQAIRALSHQPVLPMPNAPSHYRAMRRAQAELQLECALEGSRRDPQNGFFALAEASARAILDHGQAEVVGAVQRAAELPRLESYVSNDLSLTLGLLKQRQGFVTQTDRGYALTTTQLTHTLHWYGLASYSIKIRDERLLVRHLAALAKLSARATPGERYDFEQLSLANIAGHAFERLAELRTGSAARNERDFWIERAMALGMVGEADAIANGPPKISPSSPPKVLSTDSRNLFGFGTLAALGLLVCMGVGLWIVSQMEPHRSTVLALASCAATAVILTGRSLEMTILVLGSTLFFASFLLFGLPGSKAYAQVLAVAGIIGVLGVQYASGGPQRGPAWPMILAVWPIPFALRYMTRAAIPKWLAAGMAFCYAGFMALFFVVSTVGVGSASESLKHVAPFFLFIAPWLLALWISLAKTNLADAAKAWAAPIPLVSLALTLGFTAQVLDDVRLESQWAAYFAEKAPLAARDAEPASLD